MDILATLNEKKQRVKAARAEACKVFDVQIAEIDAAIKAVKAKRESIVAGFQEMERKKAQMPIDDAIVEAVKNGVRAPAKILQFLDRQLAVHTTVNSVRTRLSRLKKDGRLAHDDRGWIMPHEVSEGLRPNENDRPSGRSDADEGATSSDENPSD